MVGAAGDQIAAGVGACQPHRPGGRVGAVLAKLDHLGAVDQGQELLRARHLYGRGAREVGASGEFLLHGLQNRRVGMAETDRAVAHAVFDVLAAVGVPDAASQAARDEPWRQDRVLIVPFRVGVASAWDQVMSQFLDTSWDLQIMEPKRMAVWIHTQLRTDYRVPVGRRPPRRRLAGDGRSLWLASTITTPRSDNRDGARPSLLADYPSFSVATHSEIRTKAPRKRGRWRSNPSGPYPERAVRRHGRHVFSRCATAECGASGGRENAE